MPGSLVTEPFDFETVTLSRRGPIIDRERRQALQIVEELGDGVVLEMVAVPGGSFLMGSPPGQGYEDEGPQRRVTVAPFLLGKHPVTQTQWEAVLGPRSHTSRGRGPRRPVDSISWDDAGRFCRHLSRRTGRAYRLPSEAEWEYACRAGTTTPFSCGYTLSTDLANYNGEFTYANGARGLYRHTSTDAGSFPPNAFGLYDMHGNLWEWCADPWHDDYRGAPADGRTWLAGGRRDLGVLRGGSWHDTPDVCRSTVRLKQPRSGGDDLFGLRVAADLG
jgi:formylglycine-generating enzyme required for sulfatase activity